MFTFVLATQMDWDAIVDDSLYFEIDLRTGGVGGSGAGAEWAGDHDDGLGLLAGNTVRGFLGEDGLG